MSINNTTKNEYYSISNQPAVLNLDRRNSEYSRYRGTLDKLKVISEKMEHISDNIDGIFIKQG